MTAAIPAPEGAELTDEQILAVIQQIDPAHEYMPAALKQLARAVIAADRAALAALAAQPQAAADHERQLDEALKERDAASDYIDALLDEVLGADRHEWTSNYGHADAMAEVQERMSALLAPMVDKAWGRFEAAVQAPAEGDIRVAFEAFYVDAEGPRTITRGLLERVQAGPFAGDYRDGQVQGAWNVWQGAMASKVQPKHTEEAEPISKQYLREQVAKQMEGVHKALSASSPAPAPEPLEAVVELVVRREYHEYENSAKEDEVGYLVRGVNILKACSNLPEGRYQLYTAPQVVPSPAVAPSMEPFVTSDMLRAALDDLKANHQVVPSMHAMSSALHAALAAAPAQEAATKTAPVAWQERQEVRPGVFGDWYERSSGWSLKRPQEIDSGGIRYQFRPLYAEPTQAPAPAPEEPVERIMKSAQTLALAVHFKQSKEAQDQARENLRAVVKDAIAAAVGASWTPTAENINALPQPVRGYIHALVTNCDPAGTVADNTVKADQIRELQASNRRIRDELDTPGNRWPEARYAGYTGQPYDNNYTADQAAAFDEGQRARVGAASRPPVHGTGGGNG